MIAPGAYMRCCKMSLVEMGRNYRKFRQAVSSKLLALAKFITPSYDTRTVKI